MENVTLLDQSVASPRGIAEDIQQEAFLNP
jgi:hypothetical protein